VTLLHHRHSIVVCIRVLDLHPVRAEAASRSNTASSPSGSMYFGS
jgi:hypothetical protein